MKTEQTDPQKRVNRVAAAILSAGLAGAVVIYLTVREPEENPLIDQLENSKVYRRSLELYGGKANLLAADFSRWFDSLWHGKSLAFTVAIVSVVIAAAYYFFASPLPPDEK